MSSYNRDEQFDISVVFPSRNEGEHVRSVLDELIESLNSTGLKWEVFAIDSPAQSSSYQIFKEYAQKHSNFFAIEMADRAAAGDGKTNQYMVGFRLARGRYVIQMDSDGQDNPAQIPDFLKKLDEGYDLVVGWKQKRKDGFFYVLTSKVSNFLTKQLTGVDIHDMNCGFKGYQSYVAKRLNLRGRWYRYIPAILADKGYMITEVPIENRKRAGGKSNFNFINRVQGGVFDLVTVVLINMIGETPSYFFGWSTMAVAGVSALLLILSVLFNDLYLKLMLGVAGFTGLLSGLMLYMTGFKMEYERSQKRRSLNEYNFKQSYPEIDLD